MLQQALENLPAPGGTETRAAVPEWAPGNDREHARGRAGSVGAVLAEGTPAPELEGVVDHDGRPVRLSDVSGSWALLWWYPMADTPG